MQYIYNDKDTTYYYDVSYDSEKLDEILKKLEGFSYECFGTVTTWRNVTSFPATKSNIRARIKELLSEGETLYDNSIVRHKEDNQDYVTYVCSHSKLPDLYDYIDLLINNRSILRKTGLFSSFNGNLAMLHISKNREQCIIDGILNYINSYELRDINKHNKEMDQFGNCFYQDFDHSELRKLYKEALSCFTFNLIEKKEKVENAEAMDGYEFILKNKII